MSKKIKVGVFFGGVSPEHDVSIMSAKGIINNIDKEKFQVKQIYINKNGEFLTGSNDLNFVKKKQENKLKKIDINKLSNLIDVAFPILHGEGGEDGSIQGFFKILNIPFVGCDITSSSICLDKAYFNQLMEVNNIKQSKYIVIDHEYDEKKEINDKLKFAKKKFSFPLFVKSARTGSSVGVYKVNNWNDLNASISKSKKYDKKVLIEEGVKNPIEIEVSVLGNNAKDIKASLAGKVIPGADFYNYNDKYFDNNAQYELPAKLSQNVTLKIQEQAIKIYKISNCTGLARIDFLLDKRSNIYINEINTLPGFTPISMYPKLWGISGLSYKNLITKLITLAIRRK